MRLRQESAGLVRCIRAIAALVREVGVQALRRLLAFVGMLEVEGDGQVMDDAIEVKVGIEDFEKGLVTVGPSVTPGQRRKYEHARRGPPALWVHHE